MTRPRYLCSQLVRLFIFDPRATDDREQWVNLEEICCDGAVLECENEIRCGVLARISCDDASFEGHVTAVEREEFGWRVELVFSALTPWSIEQWRPDHAFDPDTLK
jgi:hypothetical protein